FFFPSFNIGFQAHVSTLPSSFHINFLEMLAVCSAVHAAAKFSTIPKCLAVFTNSTFMVTVFSSLSTCAPYNQILISTVDILIACSIDLHVVHVPGALNCVADAISQFDNCAASLFMPSISILPFSP
ncbi:hypothetical protein HYDPIDRAFT_60412, partial [Hydnomerulius pinastri MD-312]